MGKEVEEITEVEIPKKRRAPVRKDWLRLGGEYTGWATKVVTNATWGTFERLFNPDNLDVITQALEEIVCGPWNFVDHNGDAIGTPYDGNVELPSKAFPGPWSMPIRAEYKVQTDPQTGDEFNKIVKRGSVHLLPRDLIQEIIGAFQRQVIDVPNP